MTSAGLGVTDEHRLFMFFGTDFFTERCLSCEVRGPFAVCMSEQLSSSLRRSARLVMDTESETESFSNDSSVHGNSLGDLRFTPTRTIR